MNQSTLKRDGMLQAASADRFHLERARRTAHQIGRLRGICSINDVRRECLDLPSGNYLGSVFKDGFWEPLLVDLEDGRKQQVTVSSAHDNGHARNVGVWKYVGGNSDGKSPAASNLHLRDAAPASSFKNQGELFVGVHSNKFRTEIGF